MKAIIILSNADFSANNIGQYVEVSQLTKNVLSKQTQYGEESAEAIALNSFLTSLTNNGFLGGESPLLTDLIIPALAASHSELLYNIAHLDESGYPTNSMGETEAAETTEANWTNIPVIVNGKIIACRFKGADNTKKFSHHIFDAYTNGSDQPSYAAGFYGVENSFLNGDSINENFPFFFTTNSLKMSYSTSNVAHTVTASSANGFVGLGFVNDYGFEMTADNMSIGSPNVTGSLSAFKVRDAIREFHLGSANATAGRNYATSVIFGGQYMNSTKLTELKGHIVTLLTALHIINE